MESNKDSPKSFILGFEWSFGFYLNMDLTETPGIHFQ